MCSVRTVMRRPWINKEWYLYRQHRLSLVYSPCTPIHRSHLHCLICTKCDFLTVPYIECDVTETSLVSQYFENYYVVLCVSSLFKTDTSRECCQSMCCTECAFRQVCVVFCTISFQFEAFSDNVSCGQPAVAERGKYGKSPDGPGRGSSLGIRVRHTQNLLLFFVCACRYKYLN